jgi:hypothetical protein
VDNSAYPLIDVNIDMVVVTPANVHGPVPVLMMFGRPVLPAPAQPNSADLETINAALRALLAGSDPSLQAILDKYPAYQPIAPAAIASPFGPPRPAAAGGPPGVNGTSNDPPATQQLIADGWGYATINPTSVQADNGAGITRGIIGLVNKGQPRHPDDWGRCSLGPGAPVEVWIISRPIRQSMQNMWASKVYRATAKLLWLPKPTIKGSSWG